MNKYVKLSGALLIVTFLLSGCTKKEETTIIQEPTPPTFVGASTCKTCHPDVFNEWANSGHKYMLTPADTAQKTGYYWNWPNPSPPPGKSWADVSYVIGGFGWKARFIGKEGYLITGPQTQYNLATGEWVEFHEGDTLYTCGECHTTGYKEEGHQDNLPGIEGTWALYGIQCEECHGPGSKHVEDPYNYPMEIEGSKWLCGSCHIRGNPYSIPAKGGYIKHHEQINELLASSMSVLECVDCHDPHMSTVRYEEQSIKVDCENCHFDVAEAYGKTRVGSIMKQAGVGCEDCHMPKVSKSAVAETTFVGDIRTHIFKINPDSTAPQFYTSQGSDYSYKYITTDFSCLNGYCHPDESRSWAEIKSDSIHPASALTSSK